VKTYFKFAKVLILVGCLVVLGLNAAAQGLEKMSPDISHEFLTFSSNNQVLKVTALGREYYYDARGALNTLVYVKNKAALWGERWKDRSIFWGNLIWEKGSTYLRFVEERFHNLFEQEREAIICKL